ncbi:MAG: hypothetical protein K9L30_19110 [Desulfobacterales bacterium]|nr:hypothetical protein [Desulfobacterales bacterium]
MNYFINLYNYLYVDLEKAISLYSQLTEEVVELKETQFEKGFTSDNKYNYDFKVFKHDTGRTNQDKEQDKTTIKSHHALLEELEAKLSSSGYLSDLDNFDETKTLKDLKLRGELKNALCVKCTERIAIKDYERMKKIGRNLPEIIKLINRSQTSALKDDPNHQKIEQQIEGIENVSCNRNKKAKGKTKKQKTVNINKYDTRVPKNDRPIWFVFL